MRPRRLFLEPLEDRALLAAVITVNSNVDSNSRDSVLSLREAILVNNRTLSVSSLSTAEKAQVSGTPGSSDTDTIAFNITGTGVKTITPTSALPTITDPVVIDGYTQPGAVKNSSATGWNGQLLIELNGTNLNSVNALAISAGRSTVRGLVINRFKAPPNVSSGAAIILTTGTQNVVTGNILGADATGTTALGNAAGVAVISSTNTIGGSLPEERNIISGNSFGVVIDTLSSGNVVRGNFVGTTANGTAKLANLLGVVVHSSSATGNTIGGTGAQKNVISGNTQAGVWLTPTSRNTVVRGNLIGTDITGTVALGNDAGVYIQGSEGHAIGGTTVGEGNLISGNTSYGIRISTDLAFGEQSINNTIRGNRIGTDVSGQLPLGNGTGIYIEDTSSNNSIGGTTASSGNTIAFNKNEGISLAGFQDTNNSILGNSFFSNGKLGIDLCELSGPCGNGVTANDTSDFDIGPNRGQNYPEIAAATTNAGALTIRYSVPSLSSPSASSYPLRIEFFKADQDGQEGQTLFNVDTYSSATAGNLKTLVLNTGTTLADGDRIVATATDNAGNTSEFSASITVKERSCDTDVSNTNDSGPGSLRSALTCANMSPGLDVITFGIPGSGVQTIRPAMALPAITDAVLIDGYSQPGAKSNTVSINNSDPAKRGLNGTLLIELSGPAGGAPAMSGLTITGNGSTVRGLVINGFANSGIVVSGDNNVIAGNYIGTNAAGTAAASNGNWGVRIENGGSENVVGTNSDGVGDASERNLISGNSFAGMTVVGEGSDGNIVAGNLIGTDASGMTAVGNGNRGVGIFGGAQNNRIGTDADGSRDAIERNVISGNLWEGVGIYEQNTTENVVAGNLIGVDAAGLSGVPNVKGGVVVFDGATDNRIGGYVIAAANSIAFNTDDGVAITSVTAINNAIVGNSIYANTGLGIDLGPGGVTPNDADDVDSGSNKLQNYPEITSATYSGDTLLVTYKVPSDSENSTYPLRVEFFKADANGQEGALFAGSDTYISVEAGTLKTAALVVTPGVLTGDRILATATDFESNTSEFSASVVIKPDCSTVVTTTDDVFGFGTLREAIDCANRYAGTDLISFNIPADDPKHLYYKNDGISGRVSRENVTATTAASDEELSDVDPDWPHSWWFIQPQGDLPVITDAVTIDGYTQAGARPNTNLASSGKGLNTVLTIEIGDVVFSDTNQAMNLGPFSGPGFSTLRGLNVHNSGGEVIVSQADGTVFEGNFIGTDISGTISLQTAFSGINITDASRNRIGGPDAAARNLIDGSGGINIYSFDVPAAGNTIQGNLIGTDISGTRRLQTGVGIALFSSSEGEISDTLIGGSNPEARNLISGCYDGITLRSYGLIHDTVIEGNYLGTDVSGTGYLGNFEGIVIDPVEGEGLVDHNTIRSNRIANASRGILVKGSASGIAILSNSMYANGLGIDLGDDGIADNDEDDADFGPNNLQNFPELQPAVLTVEQAVMVQYSVPSLPENSAFPLRVEFFAADSSRTQGRTFLGFDTYLNPGELQTANFTSPVTLSAKDKIVATATDSAGNTSEFSTAASILPPLCSTVVTNTNDSGDGSLRQAIACGSIRSAGDTISFNIPGTGVKTIAPLSPLPALTGTIIVDGYTQPGSSPNTNGPGLGDNAVLRIELTGNQITSGIVNGLTLSGGVNVVRGLAIRDFSGAAVAIDDGAGNKVVGNFLGADAAGVGEVGNLGEGVLIRGESMGNMVGGLTPAERNVIVGYAANGVRIVDRYNYVFGNFIGVAPSGTQVVPSADAAGVLIVGGNGSAVGSGISGARNVIAGNRVGVSISGGADGDSAVFNYVQGNFIGTDVTGTMSLGNLEAGVELNGSVNSTFIGGFGTGDGNLIAANGGFGIEMGKSAGVCPDAFCMGTDNLIQGNYIGTDVSGTLDLGNGKGGVEIESHSILNTIGGGTDVIGRLGIDGFRGNLISGNNGDGIRIANDFNAVLGNTVGLTRDGKPLGNSGHGIAVERGNNTIGGFVEYSWPASAGGNGHLYTFTRSAGDWYQADLDARRMGGHLVSINSQAEQDFLTNRLLVGTAAERPYWTGAADFLGEGFVWTTGEGFDYTNWNTDEPDNFNGNEYVIGINWDHAHNGGAIGTWSDLPWYGRASDESPEPYFGIVELPGRIGNTIAFNGLSGISIRPLNATHTVTVLGNATFSNGGLGIDLGGDGVTANDLAPTPDEDIGINDLQNFPVISNAVPSGGKLKVTYAVPSAIENSAYPLRVEFYQADAAGQEGQTFLGADLFTDTDFAAGGKTVILTPAATPVVNGKLVATATNFGLAGGALLNTSEFSEGAVIVSPWLNPDFRLDSRLRYDVTNDKAVAPDDVLAVINYINATGSGKIPDGAANTKPYCDINGNNNVAADDVLAVINYINARSGGEGEAASAPQRSASAIPAAVDQVMALWAMDGPDRGMRKKR